MSNSIFATKESVFSTYENIYKLDVLNKQFNDLISKYEDLCVADEKYDPMEIDIVFNELKYEYELILEEINDGQIDYFNMDIIKKSVNNLEHISRCLMPHDEYFSDTRFINYLEQYHVDSNDLVEI